MDQLRKIYANIAKQLGKLNTSQKLLIGSMAVILLMSFFVVSQYAGKAEMVPLVAGGTAEDQQRVATFLMDRGITHSTVGGRIVVPVEQQYSILAQLTAANALPDDKKLLFPQLFEGQTWTRSRGEMDQRFNIALANELAQVIRNFPGVSNANVVISNPGSTPAIGAPAKKPTAQVTVFTKSTGSLGQDSVEALVDLVAGSVSGLNAADVKVIDAAKGRSYKSRAAGGDWGGGGSTYLEQAAKVEERIQSKISEHLSAFIPGVIVSVNAIVDASRKESKTDSVLPKGEGTQSLVKSEKTTTMKSEGATGAAEAGVASNTQMDINRGGGGEKNSENGETADTEFQNEFGRRVIMQVDPQGKPLKINVSVSVPKDYVTAILTQKSAPAAAGAAPGAPPAAPSDDDINQTWELERPKLEAMLRPLIDTEVGGAAVTGAAASAGNLVVSLIPVAMAGVGTGGNGAAGAGGFGGGGGLSGFLQNGLVKQISLGGLAALALGLMLLMVKKAGKAAELPTAEELVGIPPALAPGSDLVGEADESDTAMIGIEVDDEELKTSKMLEQVTELVKTNPTSAATVFSKWLTPEP